MSDGGGGGWCGVGWNVMELMMRGGVDAGLGNTVPVGGIMQATNDARIRQIDLMF